MVALLFVLLAARFVFDAASVNRGYELGDEGYFLLNLNQPDAALPPLEIYRFVSAISGGAQIGVVGARIARICAELAGSILLVAGVLRWARRRLFAPGEVSGAAFFALAMQGALLSVASRSLGYNDLTNLFTYGAVGGVFALAATPVSARAQRLALAGAVGVATGLQLVTKFPPAGILAAGFVLLVGFALPLPSRRERTIVLAAWAACFAGTLVLVVAATGGPEVILSRLAVARLLPSLTGYDPVALIARYLHLDQLTILNLGLFLGGFAVAYAASGSRLPVERREAVALGAGFVVLLLGVFRYRPNFLHPSLVVLAVFVIGTPVALLALGAGRRSRSGGSGGALERAALMVGLLLVPFIAIAGTNVPVTMRLPTHVLPLLVLLALLVLERRPRGDGPGYRTVALLLMPIAVVVFLYHHVLRPYGLRQPIYEQTSLVTDLPGVRVDLASARFLESFAGTLREAGHRPGDPLLALDYMPGLVHLVRGSSPRYNLYMFGLSAYNCFNLEAARFERPPFIVIAREPDEEMLRCLESVSFPEAFELLRTFRFPYDGAYVSFGAHDFSHVSVYGPRPSGAAPAR